MMKGSKQERSPGVWRLRVDLGTDPLSGKRRQASRMFSGTAKAADTALAKFVVEVSDGQHAPATVTLAGLLDAFVEHGERIGRSPTTIAGYRQMAAKLKGGVGRIRLAKLTPGDLDELYTTLGSRGTGRTDKDGKPVPLSAATVNRYHDLIRAACKQAVRWGWIDRNPAERATAPTEHTRAITAPTPDELAQLIAEAAQIDLAHGVFLALAATTGCRRGELCALRWSDVDLDGAVIHVRRAVKQTGSRIVEGPPKTHHERRVTIAAEVVALLGGYRRHVEDLAERTAIPLAEDPYVFSGAPDWGEPAKPNTITAMFGRVARLARLPYHLHQLRHFAATQLIGEGYDPVVVAGRLGHSDPSVTLRVYTKALAARDRDAAAHLGSIVRAPELPALPASGDEAVAS